MDTNTVVEGTVKFRDGKKWKSRWCVMRKLSPVADCLHLQLYRDSKDRYKQGQTKASLSLQHFLGVQSGFTLDKESNTIAIICQDVTVVLAFDTRERLIQWQVKIANNLGEDEQFLVQIQSAPARGKVAPGPARLHVQEHQFSLTVGVPPRLAGFWQIDQLRRYGLVESRFCFEGGSRCGRGEGLYVLVSDQGPDIARAFQLAAEGKLHTRRRHRSRTALDSPSVRRRTEADTEPVRDVTWPSCETRPDCDYGDTASVSEQEISVWTVENNMERCMSCISKLGAMSRSSTMAQTPGSGFSPAWTMETNNAGSQEGSNVSPAGGAFQIVDCWQHQESSAADTVESCHVCHSRSSKPLPHEDSPQRKRFKPPMPLPSHCGCQAVDPYSNYDVPKPLNTSQARPVARDNCCSPTDELYDTPRQLRDSLCVDYDRPPPNWSQQPPPGRHNNQHTNNRSQVVECRGSACPCHRVMSWMSLPFYCRRGYGRENTAPPPSDKIKCDCSGSTSNTMPIYATIDRSKKTRCKLNQAFEEAKEALRLHDEGNQQCDNELRKGGYENNEKSRKTEITNTSHSYMNLDFSKTLGLYENSKDVLTRVENAASPCKNSDTLAESKIVIRNGVKYCSKCGHSCSQNGRPSDKQDDYLMMEPSLKRNDQGEKTLSPFTNIKYFPGYLPMHPVPSNGSFSKTEFLKYNFTERHRNGLFGRAASSPSLTAPFVDRSRKPRADHPVSASSSPYLRRRLRNCFGGSDEDSRFSIMRRRSNSADSARYIDDLESITERTGSSSPTQVNNLESSKNTSIDSLCSQSLSVKRLNDVPISNESSCSNIPHCTEEVSNTGKDEIEVPYKKLETTIATDVIESRFDNEVIENPVTVQIKRSSSVPCKPGHNRDSSSSNDSGVSLCSLRQRGSDFAEFELPLTTSMSTMRHHYALSQHSAERSCFHASLPRRSKSSDPLRELSFQFQDIKIAPKSSSAEAEVPICLLKKETKGGFLSPSGVPYIDSRSTSSGTSDMSDYIETLSLSSYSSSDTPESLRFSRTAATTLRPRSGKEYHKIDRYFIDGDTKKPPYTIISPVVENSESTSILDSQQGI